jgi:hypothetical protein
MLINTTSGGQVPAHNIDRLRLKQLSEGGYELHVWPPAGDLLDPHGAMHIEVPVKLAEIARILEVAPHLFGSGEQRAREIVGQPLSEASE